MPDSYGTKTHSRKTKEWTLMFYFASDNPLGPTIVSQLKNLKNAGFDPEVNVVAYYDPPIPGTPTHVFDVNIVEKIKAKARSEADNRSEANNIGFADNQSLVRNMVEDKLWGKHKSIDGKKLIKDLIKSCLKMEEDEKGLKAGTLQKLYKPPDPSNFLPKEETKRNAKSNGNSKHHVNGNLNGDAQSPESSLETFLKFCSLKYPARNYALFILGHGLIVGNDVFLFDESAPTHSLSLPNLRVLLKTFSEDIKKAVCEEAQFQLVSFHSCSMSSLEVAYELKDTANYMLASQCPTSVGAWPYRQIVIRFLKQLENKRKFELEKLEQKDIEEAISDIFDYCAYNSFDFQLAGYSFDVCLCDLRNTAGVKEQLSQLSRKLIAGLKDPDPRAKDLILLAHWDAQSYWSEMYTDLFDFCLCLQRRCQKALPPKKESEGTETESETVAIPEDKALTELEAACGEMIKVLTPRTNDTPGQLIKRTSFVGAAYQYAHGLSVYFPWSQPAKSTFWPKQYGKYKLIADPKRKGETKEEARKRREENPSWGVFLDAYFRITMRSTRVKEDGVTLGISESTRLSELGVRGFKRQIQKDTLDALSFFASDGSAIRAIGDFLGPGDKVGGGDAMGDPGKVGGADGTGDPGKVGGGDGTGGDYYYSTVKNYPPFTRAPEEPKTDAAKPPIGRAASQAKR